MRAKFLYTDVGDFWNFGCILGVEIWLTSRMSTLTPERSGTNAKIYKYKQRTHDNLDFHEQRTKFFLPPRMFSWYWCWLASSSMLKLHNIIAAADATIRQKEGWLLLDVYAYYGIYSCREGIAYVCTLFLTTEWIPFMFFCYKRHYYGVSMR